MTITFTSRSKQIRTYYRLNFVQVEFDLNAIKDTSIQISSRCQMHNNIILSESMVFLWNQYLIADNLMAAKWANAKLELWGKIHCGAAEAALCLCGVFLDTT